MSEVYQVDVEITAPVYDTEVEERVARAITNLFPGAEPELRHGELAGEVHELSHFAEQLRRQEILDTARSVFFENLQGDTFAFDLKKQAAYVDRVNFAVGEPAELGDLHVRIRVGEPGVEEYIDHLAPPTEDGVPIEDD
jgi:predicted RNA binding protein with dsRBD fold (UPF0201 family)